MHLMNTNRDLLGSSPKFTAALRQVEIVAPADCAVLIQGETGTGKRAIHEQSPRRSGPFVKLNCAAIPGGLLESESFGHDKGAYIARMHKHGINRELQTDSLFRSLEVTSVPRARGAVA